MRSAVALPKAKLFTCKRCTLTAGSPIVCAVANPEHAGQGRCSNGAACNRRAKKIAETAAIEKAKQRLPVPSGKESRP